MTCRRSSRTKGSTSKFAGFSFYTCALFHLALTHTPATCAQRVFPPDDALGGAGYFAFNPLSHLTEASPLVGTKAAVQLEAEWGAHWDGDVPFVLEKSPSSILRLRFLQALFPDAHFVVIMRHPISCAYATQAWGVQHGGKNSLAADAVVGFVEHWIAAHAILEADLPHLRSVRLVHLEQLAEQPQVGRAGSTYCTCTYYTLAECTPQSSRRACALTPLHSPRMPSRAGRPRRDL